MLPRDHRLTRSGDYARVRREGRSRAHPLLILAAAPNGGETTRVGLTVGKKIGSAVARNRVKRLLREAARARLVRIRPGYDVVLIGRPDTAGSGLEPVGAALEQLLRRADLLGARQPGPRREGGG
jgi:ribonuclease P protein component